MYPKVFLGIYFDGLNAFKQQVFGCLEGKDFFFPTSIGSRDMLVFLGSSLGAFGMRKKPYLGEDSWQHILFGHWKAIVVIGDCHYTIHSKKPFLFSFKEIVIGHGSPFGDGKVAPVPI